MNDKLSLTAIILTLNEDIHLERCIASIEGICEKIIVVDSYSSDRTEEIAIDKNVIFVQNKWINHAVQFNWALDHCNIQSDWVIRIDADEYLYEKTQMEIRNKLPLIDPSITGIEMPLTRVFFGKVMKHGLGTINMLRIFRKGKARSENKWMDEHLELFEGETILLDNGFADDNLNSFGWWTDKHNGYSIREAIDLLDIEYNLFTKKTSYKVSEETFQKRQMKQNYIKLPIFIRCFIYFLYRYILRFGFLDGKEGFIWHFFQGWWYRTLVDVKIFEIKKICGSEKTKIREYIKKVYNIDIN